MDETFHCIISNINHWNINFFHTILYILIVQIMFNRLISKILLPICFSFDKTENYKFIYPL